MMEFYTASPQNEVLADAIYALAESINHLGMGVVGMLFVLAMVQIFTRN